MLNRRQLRALVDSLIPVLQSENSLCLRSRLSSAQVGLVESVTLNHPMSTLGPREKHSASASTKSHSSDCWQTDEACMHSLEDTAEAMNSAAMSEFLRSVGTK